jgi:lysophospholipase L1-like esterase
VLPWVVVCLWKTRDGPAIYAAGVLLFGAIAWALSRLSPGWRRGRAFRVAEFVLWNLVLVFVTLEAGVRLYLAFGQPPAWLTPEPDTVLYRLDPSREWLGSPPNSRGFYDEEFVTQRRPGVTRVVALGDSYSVGTVPYTANYLTLVDEALRDEVEILNFGVVHTEVPHYLEILKTEAAPLDPDLVLVGIYIGNDIHRAPPSGFFSRAGSRALTSARVASVVLKHGEPYRQASTLDGLFEFRPDGTRVEKPGMTVERHHRREWKHLQRIFRPPYDRRTRNAWRDTLAAIEALVRFCRERSIPIVATLAPDEIQVSPDLFREVLARYDAEPGDFDLRYPNRRLREKLEALGVPVLDFTEALADAHHEAPTYHLRVVHWNRRGNAVAAEQLAPWLAEQLPANVEGHAGRPAAPLARSR